MLGKNQIGHVIISILLFAAFSFPVSVQFAHVFDHHDHTPCEVITTHIHQDNPDCQICDFHLASLNYDVFQYPDFTSVTSPSKRVKSFNSLISNTFYFTNTQLRAPPLNLV